MNRIAAPSKNSMFGPSTAQMLPDWKSVWTDATKYRAGMMCENA